MGTEAARRVEAGAGHGLDRDHLADVASGLGLDRGNAGQGHGHGHGYGHGHGARARD